MINKFKFKPFKILPMVYDESLSYYEFLCKVLAKMNEVIDKFNNEFESKIEEMQEQFEMKKEEWNEYIENMREELKQELKSYIDEKCEECKEELESLIDGKLEDFKSVINQMIDDKIEEYDEDIKAYIDGKDAENLNNAKTYADAQDAITLNSAKAYANAQDAVTLNSAKAYADTQDAVLKAYFNELISNRLFLYTTNCGYGSVLTYNAGTHTVTFVGEMSYLDSTDEHGLWSYSWNESVDLSNAISQSGEPPIFYYVCIEMNPTTGAKVGLKAVSVGQEELINFNKYRPIIRYNPTSYAPITMWAHFSDPDTLVIV